MTNFKSQTSAIDIKAGLVVFLIALPLSLGISLASGAPPTAGLISAILGGLLGAFLGGSYVTINGPAAGLIVVVLSAINNLGDGDPMTGFRRMLACVVVVGVLQILSGLIKAGKFAALFPVSVVHGMLTAIGLIIMIKQSHVFFGHKTQGSIIDSVLSLPQSIQNLNPEAALIGLFSVLLLIVYPSIKLRLTQIIPAPLVVVILAIIAARVFRSVSLVSIPLELKAFLIFPEFDVITSTASLMAIFSIFFVASLESILSAAAVDKLDPLQRESNFNRELWSKGAVNLGCGLIGGLPVIAEIVRSSANISQGARTPLANFSHSFFMLLFLVFFPSILNMIPLSALAAILILVGFRLAQPKQFKELMNLGLTSFLAFITTIVVTLVEDLLVGIFAGVFVEALVSYFQGAGLNTFFNPKYRISDQGDKAILEFEGSLLFFSALKQKLIFSQMASFQMIEIKLDNLTFIDSTSLVFFSREKERMSKLGRTVVITVPEKYQSIFNFVSRY
jgi:MFS superfamily sulfate permease-like transporter